MVGQISSSFRVDRRWAISAGLASSLFWPQAAGQTPQTELRLEENEIGQLIVPATVNGEPVQAMIDNGVPGIILDIGYAREKRLVSTDTTQINGAAAPVVSLVSIGVAWMKSYATPALVDLSNMPFGPSGRPVRLVLGRALLSQVIVMFDASIRRIWLFPKSAQVRPVGPVAELDIAEGDGHQTVDATIEGAPPVKAWVDLGCSMPLVVREAETTKAWFANGRSWTTELTCHAEGAATVCIPTRQTTVKALTLGPMPLPDIPAGVVPPDTMPLGAHELVVGAPLLTRFTFVLDSPRAKLWLVPTNALNEPFSRTKFGLGTKVEGVRLVVLHVGANSPAEAAGVKAGDIIVAINGAAPKRETLRDAKLGDRLELQFEDGTKRQVSAARFY